LTRENLAVLRNGKFEPGLAPDRWDAVLGTTASRDLPAFTPLRADDVRP
jgi:sialic acid synthase SpsE